MKRILRRIVGAMCGYILVAGFLELTTDHLPPAKASTLPHTSAGEQLDVQGTWAGKNIMRALGREFEKYPDGGRISFLPRDSFQILPQLLHHDLPLGLVLDSQVPSAGSELGAKYERYVLGRFVVVVVTNIKNPTRRMTLDELALVYRGRLRSWQNISDSNHAGIIELYAPLLAKTESCVFRSRVLKGAAYAEQLNGPSGESDRQKLTSDEVITAVAKDRNGIGFLLLGYEDKLDKRVRILGIAQDAQSRSVFPSVRTLKDGSYPLWDTLSLYVHPDAPPVARQFCEYATGPAATSIVNTFRLFPDYVWQQRVGKLRLAEMATGRGEQIKASGTAAGTALIRDLTAEFVKAQRTVQLRYQPSSQAEAVKRFLNGGELLLVDGLLCKETIDRYADRWDADRPQAVSLGRMVVGVVVHPTNPIETLSLRELAGIYMGQVLNWSEVKSPAGLIHLYGLAPSHAIDQLFREKLGVSRLSTLVIRRSDTAKTLVAVAKDAMAVGFVDVSALSPNDSSVKLLKLIPAEKPFAASARSDKEDYPLARPYTLYVSSRAGEPGRELVKFLALGRGAEAIARHGLVPSVIARPPLGAAPGTAARGK